MDKLLRRTPAGLLFPALFAALAAPPAAAQAGGGASRPRRVYERFAAEAP